MNCQQFTSFIVETARGQILDAASRDGALRHAESCRACAARLAQEQGLTKALRTVAHGMKDLSAPARVEAKLLAAFHDKLASQNAPSADATPRAPHALPARAAVATHISNRRTTHRVVFAATAVAASLVLVVLAALYLRFMGTTPSRDVAINSGPPVAQTAPPGKEPAIAAPPLAPSNGSSNEPGRQAKLSVPGTNQGAARGVAPQRATLKLARRHVPTMIRAQHVIDGGSAIIEASEGETAANGSATSNEAERVTEFISLVADAPAATPLESGQLVRVQLPRAALASLGLPLNVERGNEPVKADVLLGGDGLARAIRFVR
jgi:hypothetical protein